MTAAGEGGWVVCDADSRPHPETDTCRHPTPFISAATAPYGGRLTYSGRLTPSGDTTWLIARLAAVRAERDDALRRLGQVAALADRTEGAFEWAHATEINEAMER